MPNSYDPTGRDELQHAASSGKERSTQRGVLRCVMDRLSRFVSAAIHCHQELFAGSTTYILLSDTEDEPSDAEVTHALETWNAKALQVVPSLAEYFIQHFNFENKTGQTQEQAYAMQRISEYIIPSLVESLGTKSWENVSASLQAALEACLAFALYQTWASGRRPNAKFLVINSISDVLLVAGCTSPQSDVIAKVASQFEEKMASLFGAGSGRLSKMLDDLTRKGLELFIVRPGAKFECKSMEDADGRDVQGGLVLCTTCVGLMERMPAETKKAKEREMVLKAKVLLESFLG